MGTIEALQNANAELQAAARKHISESCCDDVNKEKNEKKSKENHDTKEIALDDPIAEFYRNQARQLEMEHKLPVDDWIKVLSSSELSEVIKGKYLTNNTSVEKKTNEEELRERLKKELIDILFAKFSNNLKIQKEK